MTWLRGIKRRLAGTFIYRLWYRYFRPEAETPADLNAAYDAQTFKVMVRVLRRGSICVDIGAHKGSVLEWMQTIAPRGSHHAFEPLPHLAAELRARFSGVRIHEAALSDRAGQARFSFVENDPAYSGLRRRIYDRADPQITEIDVNVVTLDDIIPPNERIAFIKLDIEGGEYHALLGGRRTIERSRPVIVFEGSPNSTGQYGVKPEDVFAFIAGELQYDLSTMQRWLAGQAAFSGDEFCQVWNDGIDFYFIATPRGRGKNRHASSVSSNVGA